MLVLNSAARTLVRRQASSISVKGGTHNPMATSCRIFATILATTLKQMGIQSTLQLERHGFFPAGGGRCAPWSRLFRHFGRLPLNRRGGLVAIRAEARVAAVPANGRQTGSLRR